MNDPTGDQGKRCNFFFHIFARQVPTEYNLKMNKFECRKIKSADRNKYIKETQWRLPRIQRTDDDDSNEENENGAKFVFGSFFFFSLFSE